MEYLEYSDESSTSGSKYLLDCKTITNDNPTTARWLDDIQALKIIDKMKAVHMSGKKILEGLFHRRTKVVIKISDASENIEKEWTTYVILNKHNIPGILKYFCYFTCGDSLKKYINDQPALCDGPGDSLKVLVMEYINSSSLKNFKWNTVDVRVFRSAIAQVFLTALDAFLKCSFIHGDLHLDNVLLTKTTADTIQYDCYDRPVSLHGYRIKLMDFELSRTGPPNAHDARMLFKDVKVFVNKTLNLVDYFHLKPLEQMNTLLRTWIDSGESDPRRLLELIDIAQTIAPTGYSGPPMTAGAAKRRRANIYKRAAPE